jgi:hypothetical protein
VKSNEPRKPEVSCDDGQNRELASDFVPGDLAKTLKGEHFPCRTNDDVTQRAAMGFSPTDPQ